MATLYVWEPIPGSVGHASLLLRKRHIYISWWPKEDKISLRKRKKQVDGKDHLPDTYDEDVTDFNGRSATHRFRISSRKIACYDVASWWKRIRGSGGYHILQRNCCDIVYEALKVGGCFDWVHPGIKLISTPSHVIRYGRALEEATCKESPFGKFKIM